MTESTDTWEIRLEATSPEDLASLDYSLQQELRRAVPDAVLSRENTVAPSGTRALAETDLGLIVIAMTPFVAEQVVAAVRLWSARAKSRRTESLSKPASLGSSSELVIEEGDLKITIRRRAS